MSYVVIMDEIDLHSIDWDEGAAQTGASAKQVAFAKAIVAGSNKTQAARVAGYSGEGATLRSVASSVAKSPKVRQLVAWAQLAGAGPSEVIDDLAELKKNLWKKSRSSDQSISLRASELLYKIESVEMERREAEELAKGDPRKTLDEIATIAPVLAAMLARKHDVAWNMPQLRLPEALAEIEDMRKAVLSAAQSDAAATPAAEASQQAVAT